MKTKLDLNKTSTLLAICGVLAMSFFTTHAFALTSDPTLGEILSHGYEIKVTVKSKMGIMIPKGTTMVPICKKNLVTDLYVTLSETQDRILKTGREFYLNGEAEGLSEDFAGRDPKGLVTGFAMDLTQVPIVTHNRFNDVRFATLKSDCEDDFDFSIVPRADLEEASVINASVSGNEQSS